MRLGRFGKMDFAFYSGKNVLVTGHTGFKGTWLCKMLLMAGARVIGYALSSPTEEGAKVFAVSGIKDSIIDVIGDIRDYNKLYDVFQKYQPEIVFHLAAQPIVLESYRDPVKTYTTNVIGTLNVLECIRKTNCVKSFVNVTTDKVYDNKEVLRGYTETDPLDGYDPYSNSKSCSELITHSYYKSFFAEGRVAISTARAGNVIGGGDFAIDRIIPDCIRAAYTGDKIKVRNPYSVRPYQHVLEPLYVYLMIAEAQYKNVEFAGSYNVGPDDCDCLTTGELVKLFCTKWGNGIAWENVSSEGPHEANLLRLNCTKLKTIFNWKPRWHIADAIAKTVEWAQCYQRQEDIAACMENQINEFLENRL